MVSFDWKYKDVIQHCPECGKQMFLKLKSFVNALRSLSISIVVCISTSLPAMAATPTLNIQNMWDSIDILSISSNIISLLISIIAMWLSFVVWRHIQRIIMHESHTHSYDTGHLQDEGYMNWLRTKEGASNSLDRQYWDESYQDYLWDESYQDNLKKDAK